MKNILFVCTGNSCRSVMAEGIFRKMTEGSHPEFIVGSAGVSAMDGYPATLETIRAMNEEGFDVSHHRSRRLEPEMIQDADKIFVMERMHKDVILRMVPEAAPKVALLTGFASQTRSSGSSGGNRDVPDPIRMADEFYRNVLRVIRDCVSNIVSDLENDK